MASGSCVHGHDGPPLIDATIGDFLKGLHGTQDTLIVSD